MITRALGSILGLPVDGNWVTTAELWAPIIIMAVVALATLIATHARLIAIFNNVVAVRTRDLYLRSLGDRDTCGQHRPARVLAA